jgi:galactokinase
MDQYANMLGRKDHVLLLDCRDVSHEYIPLHMEGYEIILINTKVHHSLASSQYNRRREECGKGLAILQERSGIRSFRDIEDPTDLLAYKSAMGQEVYNRCLYVVEEIRRTRSAARFLKENKVDLFGELMFETHEGLRNLYQVSCPELDFLVEAARTHEGVAGARLMGGGFGGCTINLIKTETVRSFLGEVLPSYTKQFRVEAESYDVRTADGTCELKT